ncbi:hypothetical protein [Candidatus Pelagisphaera phototrophica]
MYGLLRGNQIRARQIGTDIMAVIEGGEIHEYTKFMAKCANDR